MAFESGVSGTFYRCHSGIDGLSILNFTKNTEVLISITKSLDFLNCSQNQIEVLYIKCMDSFFLGLRVLSFNWY